MDHQVLEDRLGHSLDFRPVLFDDVVALVVPGVAAVEHELLVIDGSQAAMEVCLLLSCCLIPGPFQGIRTRGRLRLNQQPIYRLE